VSLLDYYPPTGIWRELNGTSDDSSAGGGETAGDLRSDSDFDYTFACGACDATISGSDSSCPSCGEIVEWDKEPTWEV